MMIADAAFCINMVHGIDADHVVMTASSEKLEWHNESV